MSAAETPVQTTGARIEPPPEAPDDEDARASAAAAAALQRQHLGLLDKELKRVAKKAEKAGSESVCTVDAMLADVRAAQASMADAADAADARVCVDALRDAIRTADYPARVSLRAEHAKALLACVGKLGKAIAVSFDDPKTSQGPKWDVPLDDALVLDAVACHYYREGKVDLADAVVRARGMEMAADSADEASAAETRAARASARVRDETRRVVLDGIRERDIIPLLDWIPKNTVATGTAYAAGRLFPFPVALPSPFTSDFHFEEGLLFGYQWYSPGMSLELELYARRAGIGDALERGDAVEAAIRARASLELISRAEPVLRHRSAFHFKRLKRALGSAPFATGPGALARPESAFQEKALAAKAGENGEWWRDLADRFERAFWVSEFEPRESPLLLVLNAGCVSMPTLAKLASALAKRNASDEQTTLKDFRETKGVDEKNNVAALPVELPLPPERFAFGSTFACPVRRDAVFDPDEPILMLPCGVLISKGGIDALKGSRPANATFKCINCSRETDPSECKRVFF